MKSHTPFVVTVAAAVVLFSLCASTICPAEEFGVKLMRPDSLDGWNYSELAPGALQPAGWTIAAGRLSGTAKSAPLISGFSAGDCELRFQWSVSPDGAWKIFMPKVPNEPALELILSQGADCGRLSDGDKILFPGAKIESLAEKGRMHTAAISRQGAKLSLAVDGNKIFAADVPAGRYGLGLAVAQGSCELADLRGAEPVGRAMIEDESLSNWNSEDKKAWRVEKGELVLKPAPFKFLRSNKEYSNFVLSFQYKMQKGGNSGMGIRTPIGGWPSGDGMEMQIFDRPYEPIENDSQMSIYGNVRPLARADKQGEWNDVVIKADGWMISAWVNGELVQQYNTLHHPELKHRRLKGWIGPQDHGAWIRFRDLRILEAPDGTGLDIWNLPQPPTAATATVDRLMNSESVAKADGITSGVVAARTAAATGKTGKDDVQLIADLRGPGAVVRVAYLGNKGRLCFYFDGEMSPRIECRPYELCKRVPSLCEDEAPVLTYLPYKKSLKILLRDAKEADYVVDYVRFPPDLPVETFNSPGASIPRGWMEPPMYRQHVIGWGVLRERDPQLRVVSDQKTVAPGQTVELARVDGAGLVRWVKLLTWDDSLLDDLWLSVTVDGEASPTLSAPVRFWFPGLAGGGENFNNFVIVNRGGAANLLAMPFGAGLTISAENRGKHDVNNVGVELSVEKAAPATHDDIVSRPRLRGVFVPAAKNSKQIFSQKGRGRWVGLVCRVPKDEPLAAKFNLTVDGRAAEGWTETTLDEFLGLSGSEFRKCLSGRLNGLVWRYLLTSPLDFNESIQLDASTDGVGDRLALFYLFK